MEEEEENKKQTLNNNNNKIIIKIPTHKTTTVSGRLPPDALLHIWAHLPTTVLYRLRPVCHLWNSSLISDTLLPSLLRRNFHRHPPPPTLLLILRHLPDEPVKLPDRPVHISTVPASSLFLSTATTAVAGGGGEIPTHPLKNGFTPYADTTLHLLPTAHRLSPLCCFASHQFFYLCNPSINQFLRLSPPQTPPSTAAAAFGYFPLENRFVLVNIYDTTVEILEFGPGQAANAAWSAVPDRAPGPVRNFGVNVGGRFFWASADLNLGFVVCLDYKKLKFKLIPSPEGNPGEVMMYDKMYIVEFKGAVCAVDNFSRPPHMEVWVLQEEVEEFNWVRKYNILMSGMGRDVVYPFCDYYFYDEDDEEKRKEKSEMVVLCNKTRCRLYCYNVKSRSNRLVYKPKQRSFEQLALYTPGFFPLIGDSRVSK